MDLPPQNSNILHFGTGENTQNIKLEVKWPWGTTENFEDIPPGCEVTLRKGKEPIISARIPAIHQEIKRTEPPLLGKVPFSTDNPAKLHVITAMATWCQSCRNEIPHLHWLKNNTEGISFLGLPVDPEDSEEKLTAYDKKHHPPYQLLLGLPDQAEKNLTSVLEKKLGEVALPSTLVVNRKGEILLIKKGTPTLSELRSLLE